MGIEIRAKDKIFVALVMPLAIAAAYWYGWRSSAAARLSALESRSGAMVSRETYDAQKLRASRILSASLREVEAERAAPEPEVEVVVDRGVSAAEREEALLRVLRESGLDVKSGTTPEKRGAGDGGEALARAAGWGDGAKPILRRYSLDGAYPCVKMALDAFVARRMGVIVEKLEMVGGATGRWTLEVWL